jgi:hypothetical protein
MGFYRTITVIFVSMFLAVLPLGITADEPVSDSDSDMWIGDPWWPEMGHFDYSEGKAVGNYLNFGVNESTGIITDYMVTISTYDLIFPIMVYEECWYVQDDGEIIVEEKYPEYNLTYENITIFDTIEIEGFDPAAPPGTFSDMFVFQGGNALMIFYDRDWLQGYMASGDANNTVTFEVSEGLEIVEYQYYWYDDVYYEEDEWGEEEKREGEREESGEEPYYWEDYYWESPWTEVWIESENTTTCITIYNGNYSIVNNTITILLFENGYLEINTWVNMPIFPVIPDLWYDDPYYEDEMEIIESARQEGYIAGEGWYYEEEEEYRYYDGDYEMENSDFYSYDDPTFNMEFLYISDDGIEIEVESRIPEGRIVMVNLDEEALEAHTIEDLLVKLDDNEIEETDSLEELTEQVGSTEAKFFALFSEEGTTVFVYVPHFSVHTITIESILGSAGVVANVLLPATLACVVIAVAALGVFIRRKKSNEEL